MSKKVFFIALSPARSSCLPYFVVGLLVLGGLAWLAYRYGPTLLRHGSGEDAESASPTPTKPVVPTKKATEDGRRQMDALKHDAQQRMRDLRGE
jgi:hypothetical protein